MARLSAASTSSFECERLIGRWCNCALQSSVFANEAASSVACFQDGLQSQTMRKHLGLFVLIGFAGLLLAVPLPKYEPLPAPISNNALASVKSRGSLMLYSMMGIGPEEDLGRNFERSLRA